MTLPSMANRRPRLHEAQDPREGARAMMPPTPSSIDHFVRACVCQYVKYSPNSRYQWPVLHNPARGNGSESLRWLCTRVYYLCIYYSTTVKPCSLTVYPETSPNDFSSP